MSGVSQIPCREKRNAAFFMPSCYAVGAEKRLAIRGFAECKIEQGKGKIPFPLKSSFYCVTNPQQRSDEAMAVFRVERNTGLHRNEQPPFTQQGTFLKSKRACCRKCCPCRKIGTTPLQGCPISTGKVSTLSAPPYGSLKKPDISQGGRDATQRAKWQRLSTPSMSSHSPRYWKTRCWKIQLADNPILENPTTDNPTSENPMQLNKDIQRTDLPKKEKSNTDLSSTHSIPILSPNPSPFEDDAAEPPERKRKETEMQSALQSL